MNKNNKCNHKWEQTDYMALFGLISLIEIVKGPFGASEAFSLNIEPSRVSLRMHYCGKCFKEKMSISIPRYVEKLSQEEVECAENY